MASINATLSKNANYPAGVAAPGTTILPLDTGTILGHVQPGGAGQKLTDGTQQSATLLSAAIINQTGGSSTGAADGNFIDAAAQPTYYGNAAGYSQLGE